jgi:hypothetical protein
MKYENSYNNTELTIKNKPIDMLNNNTNPETNDEFINIQYNHLLNEYDEIKHKYEVNINEKDSIILTMKNDINNYIISLNSKDITINKLTTKLKNLKIEKNILIKENIDFKKYVIKDSTYPEKIQ